MTIKQQCESRIRELLPELQELKKGCEVFVNSHFGIEGYGNIQCVKNYCKELGTVSLYGHNECGKDYDIDRVIVSPITLSEILMAIEKVIWGGESYCVTCRGDIWHEVPSIIKGGKVRFNRKKVSNYDIAKSFSDQSPEFYSFLYNIIK